METKTVKAYGSQVVDTLLHDIEIQRRVIQSHDIELVVLYCGVCHTDLHKIKNDFGGTLWPTVPGHEIVGRITAVGNHVKHFKIGDCYRMHSG